MKLRDGQGEADRLAATAGDTPPFPRWFGYFSLAVGLIFLTPAFAVAFPSFGIWTLLLSVLAFPHRTGRDGAAKQPR